MLSSECRNEPVSSLSHFVATLLSMAALALLVTLAALRGTALHVVTSAIFGAALLLLYLASTLYHFLSKEHKAKDLFRMFDHSMIYILIAGTYTPVVLLMLPPAWGWSLFGVIWGLALVGVMKKVFHVSVPAWFSAAFYLIMGWLVVIAYQPLSEALSLQGFLWLLSGGLFYTVGVIFFALDHRYQTGRWYTLHDIFHIFVMLGSFCHFWFVLKFVIPGE